MNRKKYKKSKKTQIQFGETFGVIIIVYIVVMVGMVWYNNSTNKDIAKMSEDTRIERSFEKYYYIVNNNLLHASQHGNLDKEFDLVSMKVFANYSLHEPGRERVRKQLGESIVTLEVFEFNISDSNEPYGFVEKVLIYNNTPIDYKNREAFKTLIPVIDTINKETYVGILSVYVFN